MPARKIGVRQTLDDPGNLPLLAGALMISNGLPNRPYISVEPDSVNDREFRYLADSIHAVGIPAARIIARMPALIGSESAGHAPNTTANSESIGASDAPSAPDSAPPSSELSGFPAFFGAGSSPSSAIFSSHRTTPKRS